MIIAVNQKLSFAKSI